MTDITMDIWYDALKKSGTGFTDLFGPSVKKVNNKKKIDLYKDSDKLGADVTKFGALVATIHIDEDVILFTSESGRDISAYDIRKHYQEHVWNCTKPDNVVYCEEDIDSDGLKRASCVEIIGHTGDWNVEILMVRVHMYDRVGYMILVF